MLVVLSVLLLLGTSGPVSAREDPAPSRKSERPLVPGTRVRLSPPPGHEPGQGFHGYQWPDLGASIVVLELPGPYAEASAGMNEKGLRRAGMKLIDRKETRVCSRDGLLLLVSQEREGTVYRKWLTVCGDEKRALILTAVFPETRAPEISETFRKVLLGAEWDPALEIDPFAVLDWTIDAPRGLRFAGNLGQALSFTEDGVLVQKGKPEAPLFIVSPSIGAAPVEDARVFAEKRLRQMPNLKAIRIERSEAFSAGGLSGWEIVARARHSTADLELALHQVLLVRGEGYLLFVGQVDVAREKEWIERFRAACASWKPRPPDAGK